jgi:hypothetical protein
MLTLGVIRRVFISILWSSWNDDHPWDELARFDYVPTRYEIIKNQTHFKFLATYQNLS